MVLNRVLKQGRPIALHMTALLPLVWLIWDVLRGNLSLNPYENLIRRTGQAAVFMLILTLFSTPLSSWLNRPSILVFRKPLGLYTFFYALLHISIFIVMGFKANLVTATREILARSNLTLGLFAFLILLILAATSNRVSQKKLTKYWKKIQYLIYPAALLIGSHYFMARKAPTPESVLAAVVIASLLLVRLSGFTRSKNNLLQTNDKNLSRDQKPAPGN
jgi:sulfoxide reductase heme-binding subunit YedZ